MIRRIIQIDSEKCNGCGACANACHEGAIKMVDGRAKLMHENYCDGLGDCLPACPVNAISFIEREAPAYDEAAVLANKERINKEQRPVFSGCPGQRMVSFNREENKKNKAEVKNIEMKSELMQWPVQIKLAPISATYFDNAKLLVAADCTAYAYAAFHRDFIKGHVTLIGCPKLDDTDYSEKLTEIIRINNIKSIHVVRMEVPCCGGIEYAVMNSINNSGKMIPWQVTTISLNGDILE